VPHDNYLQQFIDSLTCKRHIGLSRIQHRHALGRNLRKGADGYLAKRDPIHIGNVPITLANAAVTYGSACGIPTSVDKAGPLVDSPPEHCAVVSLFKGEALLHFEDDTLAKEDAGTAILASYAKVLTTQFLDDDVRADVSDRDLVLTALG
jgi:hypothetical protein